MSEKRYDAIVIGVGGMGSATVAHLAARGADVLGLKRFDVPHGYGSSHGITRIFRLAYYEGAGYVPLLQRADELWQDLEADHDRQLLYRTGSTDAGPADGSLVAGSRRSCEEHDLAYERLSSAALSERIRAIGSPRNTRRSTSPTAASSSRNSVSSRTSTAHIVWGRRSAPESASSTGGRRPTAASASRLTTTPTKPTGW